MMWTRSNLVRFEAGPGLVGCVHRGWREVRSDGSHQCPECEKQRGESGTATITSVDREAGVITVEST